MEKWIEQFDKKIAGFAEHVLYQDARGHKADKGVIRSLKQFISDLLKERDKEWLSCIPEKKEFPCCKNGCGCGVCNQIEYGNKIIGKLLENAKAKKLI